jgi:hypothetical protein
MVKVLALYLAPSDITLRGEGGVIPYPQVGMEAQVLSCWVRASLLPSGNGSPSNPLIPWTPY